MRDSSQEIYVNKTIHTPPMDLNVWSHSDMYSRAMTVTIKPAASLRELRNISEDLQSRIDAMEELLKEEETKFQEAQELALAEHKRRTDAFRKALVGYRNILSLEQTLAGASLIGSGEGPMPEKVEIPLPHAREPLPDFFISQLKTRGPLTKEELRLAALVSGYFADGDSGGRTTHATLTNIARNGRVILGDDGKYIANTLEKALL